MSLVFLFSLKLIVVNFFAKKRSPSGAVDIVKDSHENRRAWAGLSITFPVAPLIA